MYTVKCIFHTQNEKTLVIREDRGDFHCFGCRKAGDLKDYPQLLSYLKELKDVN